MTGLMNDLTPGQVTERLIAVEALCDRVEDSGEDAVSVQEVREALQGRGPFRHRYLHGNCLDCPLPAAAHDENDQPVPSTVA